MVNFCVAILILKMEEYEQPFWHIMLYYFKKGKNTTERKKQFVQCVENMLSLIERVKSGLRSFTLEISCWTMLHGGGDQVKLIEIIWRHSLRTINIPHGR